MTAPVIDVDPKRQEQLEEKVLSFPDQAKALTVRNQEEMQTAGLFLTDRIKPLLKEADDVFDPLISAAHKSHQAAIAAKRKVTTPLLEAEAVLKKAIGDYFVEQERIRRAEEERLRKEQLAREQEEMRLVEERRREEEARINQEVELEHAQAVEDMLDALPADAPRERVEEICATPAPEPIRLAPEMPVFAPTPRVARPVAPRGISPREEWRAEVNNLQLLCKAIGEGKVPTHYVEANMTALNQMARANKNSLNIPGVRAVSTTGVSARSTR